MTYWDIVSRLSAGQQADLAQLKRIGDLLACDPEFRAAAESDRSRAVDLATEGGASGNPAFLSSAIAAIIDSVLPQSSDAAALRELWQGFMRDKRGVAQTITTHSSCAGSTFGSWQSRQKLRVASELGEASQVIPHSLIAFELARGCSVGCPFCGVDASKFAGHVPYDERMAEQWPTMLEGLKARFGGALRSGFLYWGSDPIDNPDYMKFATEFARISSVFPQITTAIPLRNVAMIREALALSPGVATVPHRFSVLSLNVFKRIMRTFSAKELLHVELVPQLREGRIVKANAGRAMSGANPVFLEVGEKRAISPSTIACVTGFLVNIGDRTVKMISPTAATAIWPKGYIVYAEQTYLDAQDFLRVIDAMVADVTVCDWSSMRHAAFRSDLRLSVDGEAFDLTGTAVRHRFRAYGPLAKAIEARQYSLGMLVASAGGRGNLPGEEMLFMRGLYKAGLLELG